MKRILLATGSLILCLFFYTGRAQVNDPGQVGRDAATNHANSDMDNEANKGLDKAEQGIGNLFKKKNKDKSNNSASTQNTAQPQNDNSAGGAGQAPAIKSYQNYDFVAGDKIIFSDDFMTDQDGEFPAHWELIKGQAVMNKQQGIPVFELTDGNYATVNPRVSVKDYLTKDCTVELDTYFQTGAYGLLLRFRLPGTTDDVDADISFGESDVSYESGNLGVSLSASLPTAIGGDNYANKWHHIAIGFKNRQVKIYVDQFRVLVVPDCKGDFGSVTFAGIGSQETPIIFKNVKIASGGSQNMIGNILTNGKFITHGITFDVDKAIIKPESMGVLNQVAKFLKDNPSINMEIDGHTDNSGAAPHNLTLSQQRADAVKTQLTAMGIDASRLSTKGFGDTKPMSDNNTPEGRANNRRVEFVKM